MDYQIRVSKAGKDALNSTDPNDFIFHSAYNTFKILETGSGEKSFGTAAGNYTATINHSVGSASSFLLFIDANVEASLVLGNARSRHYNYIEASFQEYVSNAYINSTQIIFTFHKADAANYRSVMYRYYIFETPLA